VIEFRDFDSVGIPTCREVERMPKAVVGLHSIFSEDVVRCVAIIASSGSTMTRLQPRIVLRLHDVAVGTSRGIVREVGISPGIDESVTAEPHK
jgi:hypothetical protein